MSVLELEPFEEFVVHHNQALYDLPHWPACPDDGHPPGDGTMIGMGHADRAELVRDIADVRSAFEFGGHYGQGIVSWLEAFPEITKVGWTDNEGAFAGSNAACLDNVRTYLHAHDRRCDIWYSDTVRDAVGMQFDVVLVDGDHARDATLCDLALALAMRPKALLVDDMAMGPVAEAVKEFARYMGLRYDTHYQVAAGTAVFRLED